MFVTLVSQVHIYVTRNWRMANVILSKRFEYDPRKCHNHTTRIETRENIRTVVAYALMLYLVNNDSGIIWNDFMSFRIIIFNKTVLYLINTRSKTIFY